MAQFATTLRSDWNAVELAITKPWSNGPIEGHINRLKAIKRQMFGRAGLKRECCPGRFQKPLDPAPKVRKIRFKYSAIPALIKQSRLATAATFFVTST